MNWPAIFIHRPVATILLTLGIALAGILTFKLIPVAPLPQVDFPVIQVSANLPGASPEVMAATVATPLERFLGRISGIAEMTSTSTLGQTRIVLLFDLDRDVDGAARDVQAAINAARSQLPSGMPTSPIYRKANPADQPILALALTSNIVPKGQMYDYASTVLAQNISQLDGVGVVNVAGSSLPAVRVEVNPSALSQYGISVETVRAAIASANTHQPTGSVEIEQRKWQIDFKGAIKKAEDYASIIVAYRNNAAVRLEAVASISNSVQDIRNAGSANGQPAVLITVTRQPGANIIETVERIKAIMPRLLADIPNGVQLKIAADRTSTIRTSMHDVEQSLVISIILVILVVYFFIRNTRATLIPAVAIPISLLGTSAIIYLLGFSLNNLSLMAMIIATGFVVDDAIVVVENISRHIEGGMKPFRAALLGVKEVSFTVISMSLSLVAVFIPLLLMGGLVGRLFREFAVTLSVAVIVSMFISLTTTPMMCSRLLKAHVEPKEHSVANWFYHLTENVFSALLSGYRLSLNWTLRHPWLILLTLLATIILNGYLFVITPKGFFPVQDTGRLQGFLLGDQSISFQAMRNKIAQLGSILANDHDIENFLEFSGGFMGGQSNTGTMFVTLKPREQRSTSAFEIANRLRPKLAKVSGVNLFLTPQQDINFGGRNSSAMYQYTLLGNDLAELREWAPKLKEALSHIPEFTDVNSDLQDRGIQTSLIIDRNAAARLGLTVRMIDNTLNDLFGQRLISTIYNPLNQYYVVLVAQPEFTQSPDSLKDIILINSAGEKIPLSEVAHSETTNAPLAVNHQSQFAATTISFNLAPNVSLSQATLLIENNFKKIGVPDDIRGSFQGTAQIFQSSLSSEPFLILGALIAVYIVLGVLYESFVHPITILTTLPSAGVGALLALLVCKSELSLIALIGIFLLIGVVKKNAILMIDFALSVERSQGLEPREAIFQACLLRFRPILMTTLAALLGALPLALAMGDGAELRRPLGISIVGGLIVSQLLTLYTTPVIYLLLDRLRLKTLSILRRILPSQITETAQVSQKIEAMQVKDQAP